jgi:steroid delta-isomerase-like uncharacterized protein
MGEARELGERWFETVKTGDAAAVASMLADEVDFLSPAGPLSDPGEIAGYVGSYTTAFPDTEFVIRDWVEDDERAVAEGRFTGTHTGTMSTPMGELSPTGRSVDLPFTTVFEVRDGKITAHRAYWDNATFMMQLGLMPQPGQ